MCESRQSLVQRPLPRRAVEEFMNLLQANLPLARRTPNLLLHCGAQSVQREDLAEVRTPAPTSTWQPIPHHQLIRTVQQTLESTNLTIGAQAHSLTHDGMRYFGLMEICGDHTCADYCWVLGLRNSHDKTFPAGIVAGVPRSLSVTTSASLAKSNLLANTRALSIATCHNWSRGPLGKCSRSGMIKICGSPHTRRRQSMSARLTT